MSKERDELDTATTPVSKYCKLMYQRDMVSSTGGNVSVRVGKVVAISPTGSVLAELTGEDLVRVDMETGERIASDGLPSKELPFHLGIYRQRPDVSAVIHGHSPYAVVASTMLEPNAIDAFPAYSAGYLARVTRLPLLAYHDSGSLELADAVAGVFAGGAKAVLLQNHGFIAVGTDLRSAFVTADELLDALKAFVLSDGKATPVSQEVRERLRAKADDAILKGVNA
jgi:ribulose-5-phosphate 4-epimerase/fuculose-1-phosphate aldolase